MDTSIQLPDARSPNLYITHPTDSEFDTIYSLSFLAWGDALSLPQYLVPDLDHMLWHHGKEEFACEKLLGKLPRVKGAIAGPPGNRVWVIWTRRYYGDPELTSSDNTLYILRVVVEAENAGVVQRTNQVKQMQAVLQAAQAEAAEWRLHSVKMWDPTQLVRELVEQAGVQHRQVEREQDGIASLLWYGEGSGKDDMIEWVGNEKYGWC